MLLPTLDAQRFRWARFVAPNDGVWGAGNTDIATAMKSHVSYKARLHSPGIVPTHRSLPHEEESQNEKTLEENSSQTGAPV